MMMVSVFVAFCGFSDGTIERSANTSDVYVKDDQSIVKNEKATAAASQDDQNIVKNEKAAVSLDDQIADYRKDKKEECSPKVKCEPKKAEPCEKKCEPKKCEPKKVEPKICEPKKVEPCEKKCEPKKCEPCKKKCEPKKADPCKKACKKPCDPCHPCKDPCARIVDIEIKPAYFYPQDKVFRHVYHKGGFIILGDLDFYIWKNYVTFFLEGGYFHRDGTIREPDSNIHTTVTQAPVTVGFGLNYPIYDWWDIYAKIGPNYVYTKATQHSPLFAPSIKKHCFGVTFGIGTKFNFATYGLVDIFINYRYDRKEIHDSLSSSTFHRFLGGLDIGAGLGVRF